MNFDNARIITAMVTPFNQAGHIDRDLLANLINHLLDHGSEALLLLGTTGEAPTLTHDEKIQLVQWATEIIAGRVPLIVGTGSNNTAQTIAFTNEVGQIAGVDAALVVVPYYNKPDQAGMIAHFTTVADNVNLPIFMYNIPGRTGVQMNLATAVQLAQHENIIGIKDCLGNENLAQLAELTPDDFYVYSGEDADALDARMFGAQGIISVASHIYGDQMKEMYVAFDAHDTAKAAAIMRRLMPAMGALFSHPSPSPAKAALNHLDVAVGGCRLPILTLNAEQEQELFKKLKI